MKTKELLKCNICKKELTKRHKIYVVESSQYDDLLMCSKCSLKVRKLILKAIKR